MSLAFKEAKLGLADSGSVIDNLSIDYTSKPPTPQITYNAQIPYEVKTSTCNEIKVKRAAGLVDLNFTNNDAVNPHTIKYQIFVDGSLVVDRSTGFEIDAGSTLAKHEVIYQVDPTDQNLNVQVYLWADEIEKIDLDDHQIQAGIGAEQNTKCLEIQKDYAQGLYAEFHPIVAGNSIYRLKAKYSGATIMTGDGNSFSLSQIIPYTELYFEPAANDVIYLTGISLV